MSHNRRLDDRETEPYVPDEDDPDYRYSEAAGYAGCETRQRRWLKPLMVVGFLLVLFGMVAPLFAVFLPLAP